MGCHEKGNLFAENSDHNIDPRKKSTATVGVSKPRPFQLADLKFESFSVSQDVVSQSPPSPRKPIIMLSHFQPLFTLRT
jgi:hypothetical protein